MPIYDFKCDTCGEVVELITPNDCYKIDECPLGSNIDLGIDYIVQCPGSLHRIMSAPLGIKVTGGGAYSEKMHIRRTK